MPVILTRDVVIILKNLRENYFISGFIPSGRESRYVNRILKKKSDEQELDRGCGIKVIFLRWVWEGRLKAG